MVKGGGGEERTRFSIWFGFFELEARDSTYHVLSHHGFASKSGGGALEVWDMTARAVGCIQVRWQHLGSVGHDCISIWDMTMCPCGTQPRGQWDATGRAHGTQQVGHVGHKTWDVMVGHMGHDRQVCGTQQQGVWDATGGASDNVGGTSKGAGVNMQVLWVVLD